MAVETGIEGASNMVFREGLDGTGIVANQAVSVSLNSMRNLGWRPKLEAFPMT
jgi:hypothetical protein